MKNAFILILKGMCMGAADIVPGVSGGTMAYILGIYERLIGAITVVNLQWFGQIIRLQWNNALRAIPWSFIVPLLTGIACALFFFTRIVPLPELIITHPEPIYGLFFGLIAGSVVMLGHQHIRPCVRHYLALGVGIAAGVALTSLPPSALPDTSLFIFLSGMLAITAMLLPGISGSFILLILGKYTLILGALGQMDVAILLPFALGCVAGLMSFSHLIGWLLRHYHETTLLVIIGLLVGSLRAIWPFQERLYVTLGDKTQLIRSTPQWPTPSDPVAWTVIMAVVGLGLMALIWRLSRRQS